MTQSSFLKFLLCTAVLAASALGLQNGMVLRVDHHGHLKLDAPHLSHALAHAGGADHHPADYSADHHDSTDGDTGEGNHHALHHLINTISDSHVAASKSAGSATSQTDALQHPCNLDFCFPAAATAVALFPAAATLEATDQCGGTARAEVASMRAIILLV
jgi:hypothetical protein